MEFNEPSLGILWTFNGACLNLPVLLCLCIALKYITYKHNDPLVIKEKALFLLPLSKQSQFRQSPRQARRDFSFWSCLSLAYITICRGSQDPSSLSRSGNITQHREHILQGEEELTYSACLLCTGTWQAASPSVLQLTLGRREYHPRPWQRELMLPDYFLQFILMVMDRDGLKLLSLTSE